MILQLWGFWDSTGTGMSPGGVQDLRMLSVSAVDWVDCAMERRPVPALAPHEWLSCRLPNALGPGLGAVLSGLAQVGHGQPEWPCHGTRL